MNRRTLIQRLAAGAAAIAGAGLAAPQAEASEGDQMAALLRDVIANPGKYAEIEARARQMLGINAAEAAHFNAVMAEPLTDQDAIERRWQAIDEARAESRQLLGLPLSREPQE